jgi:hypothetical protein
VALGILLSNIQIDLDESARRLNYSDDEVFYQTGESDSIPFDDIDDIDDIDNQIYHVRLRSTDRKKDINNMHYLWKKIIKK